LCALAQSNKFVLLTSAGFHECGLRLYLSIEVSPTTSDRGYVSVVRVSDTVLSHIGFFVISRFP